MLLYASIYWFLVGLTSWLSSVMSTCEVVTFPLVNVVRVFDCIDSWSLPSFLLSRFQGDASFEDPFSYLCFMFVILLCLFLAALWSPAGKMPHLLDLFCVMLSRVFVTFPYGVLKQVSYLIISIPDLCLLSCYVCANNNVERGTLLGVWHTTSCTGTWLNKSDRII